MFVFVFQDDTKDYRQIEELNNQKYKCDIRIISKNGESFFLQDYVIVHKENQQFKGKIIFINTRIIGLGRDGKKDMFFNADEIDLISKEEYK